MSLAEDLIKSGWLKTKIIIEAFRKIKREDFLLEDKKDLAELNKALPIGYGQTISQPLTVAFMLELLEPKPGDKVLDVGSGSGWTSALLASIVGKNGKVIAMEVIPGLAEFGKNNIEKYGFIKDGTVKLVCKNALGGFKNQAPYDKILASASMTQRTIPEAWKNQLKIGGRIVCPIKESIWLFIKKSEENFDAKEYPGFIFVPLI